MKQHPDMTDVERLEIVDPIKRWYQSSEDMRDTTRLAKLSPLR